MGNNIIIVCSILNHWHNLLFDGVNGERTLKCFVEPSLLCVLYDLLIHMAGDSHHVRRDHLSVQILKLFLLEQVENLSASVVPVRNGHLEIEEN